MRLRAKVRVIKARKRDPNNPLFSDNIIPKIPNTVFIKPPFAGSLLCIEDHLISKFLRKEVRN